MTAPAMFDLIQMPENIEDLPLPENGPYYVAGRKGTMVMRDTAFGRALVPVAELSHLPDNDSALWSKIAPLPPGLIGQVWSFFRAIWEKRKSEAMVYITRNTDNVYRVFVPPQKTSGGGVHADLNLSNIERGWRIVGTMHSHCNFGAYHSGTDTHDADGHDGLHITIGHVDWQLSPEYAVMLSFNKIRWNCKLEDITTDTPALVAHPEWWERYVSDPEPKTYSYSPGTDLNAHWQKDGQGMWQRSEWGVSHRDEKPKLTGIEINGQPAPTTVISRPYIDPTKIIFINKNLSDKEWFAAEDAIEDLRISGKRPDTDLEMDEVDQQASWIDWQVIELMNAADEIGLLMEATFQADPFHTDRPPMLQDSATNPGPRIHEMTDAEMLKSLQEDYNL